MRTLFFLLRKEFSQIFRNRSLLPMIFFVPLFQLLILPLASDYEVKNINVSIVDHDRSSYSQQFVSKITASGYFRLFDYGNSYRRAFQLVENDQADIIVEIPKGFERNMIRQNKETLLIVLNAINGVKASLGGAYLSQIIADFNQDIRMEWVQGMNFNIMPRIEILSSNWFNAHQNYRYYMVPGILVLLVTMISTYMCSMNIVKEKEMGTIEQINVTPIKKYQFILGKLIPFWIFGIVTFTLGLFLVAGGVYGIYSMGSIWLLYGYLALYLVALLGLGLLISTFADSQQQAMSITFFFIIIFILMSGLFTSIDSMPHWASIIAKVNPTSYFIEVIRMIVLKGSTFDNIRHHFLVMVGFAIFFNVCAILNYKKTG